MSKQKPAIRFYLFAAIRSKNDPEATSLRRVDLDQATANQIHEHFAAIHEEWNGRSKIEFTPTYSPSDSEIFERDDFGVPEVYQNLANSLPNGMLFDYSALEKDQKIKFFLGIHKPKKGGPTFYFQLVTTKNILDRTKLFGIVYLGDAYHVIENHAFAIGNDLTAIIDTEETLLFHSFHNARQILDLSVIFNDATDDQVITILSNPCFSMTNEARNEFLTNLQSSSLRKKFSIIHHEWTTAGLPATVPEILAAAASFDIQLESVGTDDQKQIVFPEEPQSIRKLLRLLTEDYYRSVFTNKNCVSNSHRPLD